MLIKRLTLIYNYLLICLFIHKTWAQTAEDHRLLGNASVNKTVPRPLYNTIGESVLNSL